MLISRPRERVPPWRGDRFQRRVPPPDRDPSTHLGALVLHFRSSHAYPGRHVFGEGAEPTRQFWPDPCYPLVLGGDHLARLDDVVVVEPVTGAAQAPLPADHRHAIETSHPGAILVVAAGPGRAARWC